MKHDGINNIGLKFGKWTVIKFEGYTQELGHRYLCKCDCGVEKSVKWYGLKSGNSRSCGCYQKEQSVITHSKEPGKAAFNLVLKRYKLNARTRGLLFELSREQFKEITQQNCHYCGNPPSCLQTTKSMNGAYLHNGIDRVDSSKGYIEGNIVPCCQHCNWMKLDYTEQEFLQQVSKIFYHNFK